MINKDLILGEKLRRRSNRFSDPAKKIMEGVQASANLVNVDIAARNAKKNAANQRISTYVNQLSSDVDLTELTSEQQASISKFLVDGRNEYAEAANALSKIDDYSSPLYMEYKGTLDRVNRSFKSLASQVDNYKNDKIAYLKDHDESLISDGNTASDMEESSKMYTNEAQLGVGSGGQLVFWNEENARYTSYGEMPKAFLKDFTAADQIITLNENLYNKGYALTGATETLTRQKLQNMVSKGGRDTLLSLASDDFIIEGGLGLQDPSLFEVGNDDALRKAVIDGYMDVLSKSARAGQLEKQPKTGSGGGGFNGALRDEIAVSGSLVQGAYDFSQMTPATSSLKDMVNTLNTINPSKPGDYLTKDDVYTMFLETYDMDDEPESLAAFKRNYGDSDIFVASNDDVVGIPLDINNPKDLHKLYIQSTKLSEKAKNHFIGKYGNSEAENKTVTSKKPTAEELIQKYRN
tara:strand:+ start:17907 stop:19298 length:1392 start_codon:yes stop_codon:yes gene_type:complete